MSAHSSPVSANGHPSPPGMSQASIDPNETSPNMMQASTSYVSPLNLPRSPTVQIPGQRYDYEFGMASPSDRWASPAVDANELKFFPSGSGSQQQNQNQQMNASAYGHGHSRSYSGPGPLPGLDTTSPYIGGYEGSEFGGMGFSPAQPTGGTGTTPPSAGFAAPGLPFHGLDFIRNYNPAAGPGAGPSYTNDPDQYWQTSYDSFGVDPEIAFTLGGDFTTDGSAQPWGNGQ